MNSWRTASHRELERFRSARRPWLTLGNAHLVRHLEVNCTTIQHSEAMAKRKKEESVVRLSVSMSEKDSARLQGIADSLGVSLSWVVRRASSEFLERHASDSDADLRSVLRPLISGGSGTP